MGAGSIAAVHLKALTTLPGARMIGLADPNLERAQQLAEGFRIPRVVSHYRDLLELRDLDLVSIATPHHLHLPVALDCFSAGKDVLCEKPLARSFGEASQMVEAAKRYGRRLFPKHYKRHVALHQRVRELLAAGFLGKPYLGFGVFLNDQRAAMNDPRSWRGHPSLAGGGILIDAAFHLIDLFCFWLGEVAAVSALGRRLLTECEQKGEDTALVLLEFASGAVASLVSTYNDSSMGSIHWTKRLLGGEGSFDLVQQGDDLHLVHFSGGERRVIGTQANWWEAGNIEAIHEPLRAYQDGTKPLCGLEEALHVLKVVEAAYLSNETGQRVPLG